MAEHRIYIHLYSCNISVTDFLQHLMGFFHVIIIIIFIFFIFFLLLGVFDLNVWYRNILEFPFLLVNIYIYGLSMNEKYNELYIFLSVFEYTPITNTIETQ